ncbi:MAG: hypothetical protein HKM95_05615, partial [Inquilinus sp.]|nr:hypothetical protein [Inquilinus sp.]
MTNNPGLFGTINLGTAPATRPTRAAEETPFRLLILGDFSGRESRGVARSPGDALRPIAIDRDEFEAVFRRLGVEVAMTVGDSGRATVSFGEFDELHPDHI